MGKKVEVSKEQGQKQPATKKERVTDVFRDTIKAYLDKRAADDPLFAETYRKENKSLDECCNYILQQVRASGCNGFADEEIYGMAVHYYDEDDIRDVKPQRMKVVVNHVIELSEEEKAQAREKAKSDFEQEQLARLREQEQKREERERKAREERLRKQQEARERERRQQLSLFDM